MKDLVPRDHKTVCRWLLNVILVILPFFSFSQDLGNGFVDHGVAAPVSNHRGTVATVDANGRNVVLTWLFDHRGGYALLMVDAETGKSEEFPVPFKLTGDSPYASLLSSKNKFYTLYNGYFIEFDPVKRAFTFSHSTSGAAMSFTEDDQGKIWAITYPNSFLTSFDPKTREFVDYGAVYQQNWYQYQRSIAVDAAGWVYFSVGFTASQIVAFNPLSRQSKPLLEEEERVKGMAYVYAAKNGKVYGKAIEDGEDWYEIIEGNKRKVSKSSLAESKKFISGTQTLFHKDFPDGKEIKSMDLANKVLTIENPKSNTSKDVSFDYSSEGAIVMGVALAPNGTISGGTTFPMRFFTYDPANDAWTNKPAYEQFNTLASQGDRLFMGGYGNGFLLEWDPSKPWVDTKKDAKESNPLFRFESTPIIHRPNRLLAHPDGKTIIMGGTPAYGYTGGGLLFWDREKEQPTLLEDKDVIPDQSTVSLVALPNGNILGGTTTAAGTGGEKKANQAELYIMDLVSKKMIWHQAMIPGIQTYSDLSIRADGLVYGMADGKLFFVFDPVRKSVVYQKDVAEDFGPATWSQCPRIFVQGPNETLYVLFKKGIAQVEPDTYEVKMIAESPVPILAGGAYYQGRIYFSDGSHLCSYKVN